LFDGIFQISDLEDPDTIFQLELLADALPVGEPATRALLGLGLTGVIVVRRRARGRRAR
jgi:hypothetical protein